MKKILLATLSFSLAFITAHAAVNVKNLEYVNVGGSEGKVVINIDGDMKDTPQLTFRNDLVQVEIPDANVKHEIKKNVDIGDGKKDTMLWAYQYGQGVVRVRTILPFSIKGREGSVSLNLKDNALEIVFPKLNRGDKKTPVVAQNIKGSKKGDDYDVKYLDGLLASKKELNKEPAKEKEIEAAKADKTAALNKIDELEQKLEEKQVPEADNKNNFNKYQNRQSDNKDNDVVSTKFSSTDRPAKQAKSSSISFIGYAGKFIVYLGLVLLLFIGLVQIYKKGVFKKAGLGFLNNSQLVSVLNTTYIGPKRSLLVVKVHNQVFLLGSSESGVNFLSELNDLPGVVKNTEKHVTGNNFDSDLERMDNKDYEELESKVHLKALEDNPTQDMVELSNVGIDARVAKKASFADEIKKRMKNLKPLQ